MIKANDIAASLPEGVFKNNRADDFRPKLTFEERCGIYAAHKMRISNKVLAIAFGVDRRTVGHITNQFSVHYKNVRREYVNEGHDAFVSKYFTKEVADKIAASFDDKETKRSTRQTALNPDSPSKRSKGKAGLNIVKPPQCSYNHRIEVQWFDKKDAPSDLGEGWYFRDLDDKETPDAWFHNGPVSLKTSQACLKLAEENLEE